MLDSATLYEKLTDEENARSCAELSESACRATPRNFLLILLTQSLTKLGDAIASPKTVLAWVMATVQAPVALTGMLVPIRESGSLIPQLVIAGWVRQQPIRKWIWVLGSVAQGAAVVGIGIAALELEGLTAGWAIVGLLTVFSLARGFCSVASKDVLGKTVTRRRRGQLTGWSASTAGLISIVIGAGVLSLTLSERGAELYGWLLVAAGLLWFAAAAFFSRVIEFRGETERGRSAIADAYKRAGLLVSDKPFRLFVITRALLLCSSLSAPYYVLLARDFGGSATLLGLFVIAGGLASLASAPIWGRFADRSSQRVMTVAALASGSIGIVVFGAVEFLPALAANTVFFPLAYFVLSVAHDGVRVGRKTYVVDLAAGNRRTDYVAVSNTVIGVVLLIAGLSGALSSVLSLSAIVLILSLLGLAGAWLSTRLREVQ